MTKPEQINYGLDNIYKRELVVPKDKGKLSYMRGVKNDTFKYIFKCHRAFLSDDSNKQLGEIKLKYFLQKILIKDVHDLYVGAFLVDKFHYDALNYTELQDQIYLVIDPLGLCFNIGDEFKYLSAYEPLFQDYINILRKDKNYIDDYKVDNFCVVVLKTKEGTTEKFIKGQYSKLYTEQELANVQVFKSKNDNTFNRLAATLLGADKIENKELAKQVLIDNISTKFKIEPELINHIQLKQELDIIPNLEFETFNFYDIDDLMSFNTKFNILQYE